MELLQSCTKPLICPWTRSSLVQILVIGWLFDESAVLKFKKILLPHVPWSQYKSSFLTYDNVWQDRYFPKAYLTPFHLDLPYGRPELEFQFHSDLSLQQDTLQLPYVPFIMLERLFLYFDVEDTCVRLFYIYTPAQRSWRGVYWIHLVRLSVCPSVRLSVDDMVSGA